MKFMRTMAVLGLAALFSGPADAQVGHRFKEFMAGGHPVREMFSAGSCGASAMGSCSSAKAGACGTASAASCGVQASESAKTASFTADTAEGRTALFYDLVRVVVARKAHEKGVPRAEAHAAAQSLTNSVIDGAMKQVKVPVGALGDGHILQILIDFLNSPIGQMLLNLLLSLLGL